MGKVLSVVVFIVTILAIFAYVYITYEDEIRTYLFGEQPVTIYIESASFSVSVADEEAEWRQGLSGVSALAEREGKLFVFPEEEYYGMWMKDMLLPLDIIWINDAYEVVHIEEALQPESYPESYTSNEPARFVLEVNQYIARTYNIEVGDQVLLPPSILPPDLKEKLQ